jgi:hypothetical protein
MTTAVKERKARRSREEILSLVDKAEKLISNGTPKTRAAEEVGLTYQVLSKHLGEGIKSGKQKTDFMQKFLQNIREEVKWELRQKLMAVLK